jgi:hypothetical protein
MADIITNQILHTTFTYTESAGAYNIVSTADTGFLFDSATTPRARFDDDFGGGSVKGKISTDLKTCKFSGVSGTNIRLTGATKVDPDSPAEPTITNNIVNTTYTYSVSGGVHTIVVTADTGYQFNTAPTCAYTDSFGGTSTANGVISTNKSKATFTIDDTAKNSAFNLNGEVAESTPTITITNNIEGTYATCTYDNGTFNVTIKGTQSGYVIQAANVTYTDTGGVSHTDDMTIPSSDTATIAITNVNTSVSVVINGTYIKAIPVKNTLYNCTYENIPTYYTPNDKVNVTIHAKEGSKFTSETDPPEIRYTDEFGGVQYKRFTISDDGKQGSVTLDIATECPKTEYIEFRGGAQVEVQPSIKNYGSINVYVVTLDNLDAFSKKRYFTESGTFITYEQDLSEYINRIKRIYTHIPTKGTDRIKCGNYDTEINAELPEKDIITLDFGGITIPRKDNTTLDKDMIIEVFLPFVGIVSLSSDYVGKTVKLVYDINVISGDGVCKLLDSNDLPIQLHNVQPNTDILYTTYNTFVIGSDRWDAQNLYGLEPFVRLNYFTNEYSDTRGNDYKKVVLSQCAKGFYKFDEIVNNDIDNVPKSEYNEIVNLLQSGVFID